MLGIEIAQTAVAKYMIRHRKPPSQTWRTFLDNHAEDLVSIDVLTIPTTTFRILVLNEPHPKRLLRSYFSYYHTARTHLALDKQCPEPRQVESPDRGKVVAFLHVGSLHHEHRRAA